MAVTTRAAEADQTLRINVGSIGLDGNLVVPHGAMGVVLFAHGSGSGRYSPRNRFVAHALQEVGLATLLIDLLTAEEEAVDMRSGRLRFDIGLLAGRLVGATDWLLQDARTAGLLVGYFGASTGGGAALVAASQCAGHVGGVVLRGGRPDLAFDALADVRAPTLLIVGGDDHMVIDLNRDALGKLAAPIKELIIIPDASHLFEEPGKLEEVARLAGDWFLRHLAQGGC